jgi:hypothetical protein
MKSMSWIVRTMAALAAIGFATQLSAQATPEGSAEIRVFVLDKVGTPVDIHSWTGAVEVTPEHGTARSIKLEPAAPHSSKEHSKAAPEPERYSNSQDYTSRTEEALADGHAATPKDRMLCGEAKKLDDGWVEFVVVSPKMMMKAKHAEYEGFMHDHGAWYLRAPLDPAAVRDTKTNTINFSAKVTFTTPNGDTKYVKGFTYPAGMIDGALGHLIDKDFNDTSKFDHDQAGRVSHKVQFALDGLPALSFANDKDRQEYEKARQDCTACCKKLEQATGKDIASAADDCKLALKEVRSQAADAQGAMMAQ